MWGLKYADSESGVSMRQSLSAEVSGRRVSQKHLYCVAKEVKGHYYLMGLELLSVTMMNCSHVHKGSLKMSREQGFALAPSSAAAILL